MASLAVVALGCFSLTLPALAAARWMRLELGPLAGLLPSRQPSQNATAISDPPRISPPLISPWIASPTPADPAGPPIPTPILNDNESDPGRIEASAGDDVSKGPDPTQWSAADEADEDRPQADTPEPGNAVLDGPAGADPSQTIWLTDTPGNPQPSPTLGPPRSTPTTWTACSDPAGQGCSDTLPTH
jgi:hypothetical protein